MAIPWDALSDVGEWGGTLIGELLAAGDYEAAEKLMAKVPGLYESIDPRAFDAGPTAHERVQSELDPTPRLQQARVLDELARQWGEGGLDAGARADLAEGLGAAAQQERAQRGAILQGAAARGRTGSGTTLAAQMAAQQQSADRASRTGLRAAGDAQARAYQALADSGDLAGVMRGEDYRQASDRASARDRIEQFNKQNQMGATFRKVDGLAGAYGQQAGVHMGKGKRKVNTGAALGRGIGSAAGTVGKFATGGF